MVQIEVKDLCLGYEKQIVVKDLNFVVNEGDYLCVIGENGSGKTTLVKALLSLNEPVSGQILFHGGLSRNEIGYLPQQNNVQRDFPATVREIVMSGFAGKKRSGLFNNSEQKESALYNMEKMKVADLADLSFSRLSGGQQQRVLLARALCASQKILLLDEPVSGLDVETSASMYELVRNLNKEGMSILMVTHDLEDVMKDASHVLKLGKRNSFMSREEYLRAKEENHVF